MATGLVNALSGEKSSSELLQNMVNNAMIANQSQKIFRQIIKQEPDFENSSQINSIGSPDSQLNNPVTLSTNPENSLISTNGIAKIPIEPLSPITDEQTENIGMERKDKSASIANYMQLHYRRPTIRVIHNPLSKSHPLRICRQSNRVQVEATVNVPRTDDLQGITRSPTSSPMENPNIRRNPVPHFASWLSEHFKQDDSDVFSKIVPGQNSTKSSLKKLSKSVCQPTTPIKTHPKLPQFLIQFTNNPSSHIINSSKTVEIPTNDAPTFVESDLNGGRKSQRLMEKGKEPVVHDLLTTQVPRNDQFKELKNEILKMRKQMCRDRCRFVDECRAMRKEFESLKQILLLSLHLNRASSSNEVEEETTHSDTETTRNELYADDARKRGNLSEEGCEREVKRRC